MSAGTSEWGQVSDHVGTGSKNSLVPQRSHRIGAPSFILSGDGGSPLIFSSCEYSQAGTELVTLVTPILSGNGPPVPFSVEMGPLPHSQWKWGITTHFQ